MKFLKWREFRRGEIAEAMKLYGLTKFSAQQNRCDEILVGKIIAVADRVYALALRPKRVQDYSIPTFPIP